MNKKILFIGFGILLLITLLATYVYINKSGKKDTTQTVNNENAQEAQQATTNKGTLTIGNPNAKVTIVEYSDFKCPECNKYYQNAGKQIKKDYIDTGKIKIIFKPYPLFGDDSGKILYTSYCANEQGKFAEFHDAIFSYMWENYYKNENYDVAAKPIFSEENIFKITDSLALDKDKIKSCIDNKTYFKYYEQALLDSGPDEIQGTPSFIIGGQKIVGPQPFNIFKTLIEAELRKQS